MGGRKKKKHKSNQSLEKDKSLHVSQSKTYKSRRKSIPSMERELTKKLHHKLPLIILNNLFSPFRQISLQDSVESQDFTNRKWTVISVSILSHLSLHLGKGKHEYKWSLETHSLKEGYPMAFFLVILPPWSWKGNFRFWDFGFIFSKKMSPVINFWYTLEIFQNYRS